MADSQMESVKRAYAEIMLNVAKESAARILAAERRAAALVGGLAAAKDDAVAALIRLKAVMDSRIKEVELQSLAHVKKIQDLEAQLHDAHNTIASLQIELQKTNIELEQTRKTLAEENRNSLSISDHIDYRENSSSNSKMHHQDGSTFLPTRECSYIMNKNIGDGNCHVSRNPKENGTVENLDNLSNCSPDLASFITRRKETELYRNGCTQRIRALEQHSLSAETPLEQSDKRAGELKSHLMTDKNDAASSIVEEILQTKSLTNYKRRRGRRSKLVYQRAGCHEQGKTDCKPSDTSNSNGCMLLLKALDQISPTKVSTRQGVKQFTDLKDDLLIGKDPALNLCAANPVGTDVLQVKNMQMHKKRRSKTIRLFEPGFSDSKGVPELGRTLSKATTENSMSDSRLSSERVETHSDTPPRVGGPLLQCTTGNVTCLTDAKPSQFEPENSAPLVLEPTKNEIGDEGNLPVDHPEGRMPENNTAGWKEVNEDCTCNLDADKVDASIVSSLAKEGNANSPRGASIQPEVARCIKYTFNRRKRRNDSLDSTVGSAAHVNSSTLTSPVEKLEPETKPQTQVLLMESPRSNRRLVQVARQLISLSGKKW